MIRFLQRLGRARNVLPSRSLRLAYYSRSRLRRRAPCLFVSAFPKSGSTFLVTALVHASGYSRYFLGQNFNSEHDLNFPRLVDSWAMPVVSHQHTRATPPNLEYLEQFKIRPVILIRNLADCLVSLRDHLCTESLITPTFCAQPGFADWPVEQQFDALVDLAAGWYLDFYSGWRQAQTAGVEMLWLDYTTLITQPGQCLQDVMDFYHLPVSESQIQEAVNQTTSHGNTTRKNVGISGRGKSALTCAQFARLELLTGHYPDTDFTSIGAPFSTQGDT